MRSICYLTFNDPPGGIFYSQVTEVVKFLRHEAGCRVTLISFVSLRNFTTSRSRIRNQINDAVVLPMFPGVNRWRKNRLLLSIVLRVTRPGVIIGRGVFATQLAFTSAPGNSRVVYDGRGAIASEFEEYAVVEDLRLLAEVRVLESSAVLNSAYRIAVSRHLLSYWQYTYGYRSNYHSVIPCTLNTMYTDQDYTHSTANRRTELGYSDGDVVYVYSGSVAGWQSLTLMKNYIKSRLETSNENKLLFLSQPHPVIDELIKAFPTQVAQTSLKPDEVPPILACCDYGLLIREKSVTNRVASPVKFAEYLACGLPVVISEELGDYSDFVVTNRAGIICTDTGKLSRPDPSEKERMRYLALTHFSKSAYRQEYLKLVKLFSH